MNIPIAGSRTACATTEGKADKTHISWLPWKSGTADDGTNSNDSDMHPPNPEHARKALSLVSEWIRRSDAKAGVTLAFAGVGTIIFNLVKVVECRTLVDVSSVVTCVQIEVAGALYAWTLKPPCNIEGKWAREPFKDAQKMGRTPRARGRAWWKGPGRRVGCRR